MSTIVSSFLLVRLVLVGFCNSLHLKKKKKKWYQKCVCVYMNSYNLATGCVYLSHQVTKELPIPVQLIYNNVYLPVNTSLFYFPTSPGLKQFPRNCPRNVVQETEKYIRTLFWTLNRTVTHKILQAILKPSLCVNGTKFFLLEDNYMRDSDAEMWDECVKNTAYHSFI